MEYWSDMAEKSRGMAIQQGAAPAAKPTGGNCGNGHDGHKSPKDDHRNGCDNHKSWNQQSTPPPPLIILIILRPTVLLPKPKGPRSSLRSLAKLVPHLMLMLILIIIFPIGTVAAESISLFSENCKFLIIV